MKDIKSLYLAAKTSGKSKDIASYTEAINHLLESDPNGYILNLEYIIKSDIGLKTIEPFVEKYGFPIALYDTMVESLNACIEKCHQLKKDDSLYTEMVTYFENWKLDHLNCFMMFENFGSNLPSNYVSTYYESNNKGIQNRKLVAGMINAFGEAAIPDMIITADSINAAAVKTVFEYVKANESYKNPTMYEWMSRISDDIDNISESVDSLIFFNENCLTSIVNAIRSRQQKLYKESVIMQNNDILMEYSDSDLDAIQNLISFKEYEMTWADEFTEKKTRNDYVRDRFKKKYKYDPKTNTIEVNGDRIKVDMDDSYVRIIKDPETGEIYDNDLRDGTSIEMHPNKDLDLLILDKKFFRLKNDKRREAILQHELGHRKLHRYDAPEPDDERKANEKHAQKYLKNKVNDHLNFMELEADRFAANKAGAKQVIRGLRDFAKPSNKPDIVRETKSYKKHFPDCDVTTKDISTGELAVLGSRNAENKIRNKALRDPVLANSKSYKESYTTQLQDEIYSLYEEFDGILNPDGSPTPEALDESKWFVNTRNKKTGELPSYLSDNHDLKYGEEDEPSKATADATEDDPPLDYYKRPSTSDDSSNKSDDNVDNNLDGNVDIDNDNKSDKEDSEETTSSSTGGNTNNYYYYTYTNSLNKNTNSYNKNHSDDHSTNKGNNRDNEIHDNHSSGDNRGNHYTGITPAQESVNNSRKLPDALLSKNKDEKFEESCYYKEEVGDADDDKPKSDHPIKDTLQDIDSALLKHQQNAKKAVQNAQNAGRAFVKPFKRTEQWISKMVYDWKDKDENKIKEKMADPHARSNLFDAIKKATMAGSLLKAGLLLNPVFLVLSLMRGAGKNNKEIRLRNEMIGELKTELAIIDEKIKDADNANDTKAKYRLMRLKNEINKKLLRVGGDKQWKKFI